MRILDGRRRFLRTCVGSALSVGVDACVPSGFLRAATHLSMASDNVLVIVQLSGGNDGLNTVVPFRDEAYRKARPKLALSEDQVIRLDDQTALHPSLKGLAELFDRGLMTIVQGVGYDRPNRSHFESMDIWHTCQRKSVRRTEGWIGRYLDGSASLPRPEVAALHFGRGQQPLALASENIRVPSVKSIDEFRLKNGGGPSFQAWIEELTAETTPQVVTDSNSLLNFVQSSTQSALVASQQVNQARSSYRTSLQYPQTELSNKLSVVAQLIDADLGTKIYYLELDGFDTHAEQANTHSILLKEWGEALHAFVRDVEEHGHGQRVNVMTFSEFGRRVAENASGGTDHGAAAPMFFAGGGLRQGIIGQQPSLVELEDGDLKYAIDFRQVFATVVRDHLSADPTPVIGGEYVSLPLFDLRPRAT